MEKSTYNKKLPTDQLETITQSATETIISFLFGSEETSIACDIAGSCVTASGASLIVHAIYLPSSVAKSKLDKALSEHTQDFKEE